MLKKSIKLGFLSALPLLAGIILFSSAAAANAGIFAWFSDPENGTSDDQPFSFFSSFLSVNGRPTTGEQPAEPSLSVIQNNSLVSITSPLTTKPAINIRGAVVRTGELSVLITAYSSTPDQTDNTPFVTAMGTRVRDGIIATNFLPFGTKIKMPEIYGNKIFVVEDRMNRRYWHVIDVWLPDRASALEFGVKKVKIQILES